jgi:hypothetical protein
MHKFYRRFLLCWRILSCLFVFFFHRLLWRVKLYCEYQWDFQSNLRDGIQRLRKVFFDQEHFKID